ncbi:hypothetical protein S7711_11344 [Stachybotrys chartarum IBT 7711]|uniref:Uncharacterized protein n=1 Tax=Stachybotrys chartarum (strain CBS 109288 / IBT 7711) TaxID=1280523 RepID=A0A084AX87_STACB|nr:hypothetical protein S7711_11344 [Stachybotrys chartarum IBT 7711]KFA48295.1 hypothetical protein S40293_11311 [Stachybotrys chartarum IBT 40293]
MTRASYTGAGPDTGAGAGAGAGAEVGMGAGAEAGTGAGAPLLRRFQRAKAGDGWYRRSYPLEDFPHPVPGMGMALAVRPSQGRVGGREQAVAPVGGAKVQHKPASETD